MFILVRFSVLVLACGQYLWLSFSSKVNYKYIQTTKNKMTTNEENDKIRKFSSDVDFVRKEINDIEKRRWAGEE